MPQSSFHQRQHAFLLNCSPLPALGYIYLIGGSVNEQFGNAGSRVVKRLHLRKGCLERTQPLPNLVFRPAVATSPSAIAVCGGTSDDSPVPSCQVFLSASEKYVELLRMPTIMFVRM